MLAREGLDVLLVASPANRFYLSGFELHDTQCNESSGCLVITRDGKDWLCTDSRYELAAAELWDKDRWEEVNSDYTPELIVDIIDEISL